jgi:Putative zinc-finger
MMSMMECPEARVSLGVYVLGAIEPADRALVDAHLMTCRDCRDELAGLAGLPALLSRVSAEEAFALAAVGGPSAGDVAGGNQAPQELLATVIDLTAARRRRRRWRDVGLGVAAALIIATGVFGGLRIGTSTAPPTASGVNYPGLAGGPWRTVTTSASGMSASVAYRPMGWGTQLAVEVRGIPVGVSCKLWVIGADGSRTAAGGWVTDNREGTVWYPGSAGVAESGVRGFQVTVAGAQTLRLTA